MEDFVPTRVSKAKKDAAKEFVSINYEKPKKKKRKLEIVDSKDDNETSSKFNSEIDDDGNSARRKQELEMKRVRYEVMKFGMSGFKGPAAEEAEVALAVSLGAKPPKRKGINYKLLKEQRKQQKETQQKDVTLVSGLEKSLTKHKKKRIPKKGSDGLLGVYGKVNKKVVGKMKK
ncbi:uncharacterized protein C1orf131-like [Ceratina calcarata]|uniref:Uncharacterized protein C1orf131-like n=1 Tax=Ceratina calcarata TaxID=156304 RepID=A0AAJ7N7G9_9HYME|nr:uncharacterized protein C1orf131-like [Ceratina calcarata]